MKNTEINGMQFLTTKEVCEILQVDQSTIWRWRNEGMPYIKVGRSIRFEHNAVSKWFLEKTNG